MLIQAQQRAEEQDWVHDSGAQRKMEMHALLLKS